METILTPIGLFSVATALAGVLLFGFAPYLPSFLSASLIRLTGFWCVCTALAPLFVLSDFSLAPVALVGGTCFGVIVIIHLLQTRRKPRTSQSDQTQSSKSIHFE